MYCRNCRIQRVNGNPPFKGPLCFFPFKVILLLKRKLQCTCTSSLSTVLPKTSNQIHHWHPTNTATPKPLYKIVLFCQLTWLYENDKFWFLSLGLQVAVTYILIKATGGSSVVTKNGCVALILTACLCENINCWIVLNCHDSCILEQDISELRNELQRKELLIQKHLGKIHNWQQVLEDINVQHKRPTELPQGPLAFLEQASANIPAPMKPNWSTK